MINVLGRILIELCRITFLNKFPDSSNKNSKILDAEESKNSMEFPVGVVALTDVTGIRLLGNP